MNEQVFFQMGGIGTHRNIYLKINIFAKTILNVVKENIDPLTNF